MISLTSAVSTPNLYKPEEKAFFIKERDALLKTYANSTRSLSKLEPVRNRFESCNNLNKSASRGSNIMITTSFVNLSQQEHNGSNKGVYFRPVVSSEVGDTGSEDEEADDTESSDSGKSLTPPIEVLVQRLRGPPTPPPPPRRRPTIADRRLLAEELNKLKLERERKNSVSVSVDRIRRQSLQRREIMDTVKPQRRLNSDKLETGRERKHERSSLFELFTFGLISGRKKKGEKNNKKKENVAAIPTRMTAIINRAPVPEVEDFVIIPLHPPKDEIDEQRDCVTIV